MGCDRVAKVEIVLADRQQPVRVSDNDPDPWHKELFWAVRAAAAAISASRQNGG
jgi:hypothetical protein